MSKKKKKTKLFINQPETENPDWIEKIITRQKAQRALDTLHKYFEFSNVIGSNSYDKPYEIEKMILKNDNKI